MRNLKPAAEFQHPAVQNAKPLVRGGFLAFAKKHLHPQTDTENDLAASRLFLQERGAAALQRLHRVIESPDAGEHDLVRRRKFVFFTGQNGTRAELFQRLAHAVYVPDPVIKYRYHIFIRGHNT